VFAYRPFDGTDAGVAKLGEVEIELAPAGEARKPAAMRQRRFPI
jgi:hypothetical protein